MILRNPPPLRQMIIGRHGWWSRYLGAAAIAWQTPTALGSVANAARCRTPSVFLVSQREREVEQYRDLLAWLRERTFAAADPTWTFAAADPTWRHGASRLLESRLA